MPDDTNQPKPLSDEEMAAVIESRDKERQKQVEAQIKSPQQRAIENPADVPREIVTLPSEGKIYIPGHYLCDQREVAIRSMTIKDEDILSSEALIKSKQAIDEFVKSAVDNKVDVNSMCLADRDAIMFCFRATGYGPEYDVSDLVCPECDSTFSYQFNLKKMSMHLLDTDPVAPNMNLFKMPGKLPKSGAEIEFSIMTVGMLKDIERRIADIKRRQKVKVVGDVSLRMFAQIQKVNHYSKADDSGLIEIQKFVDNMPALDSRFLRAYINKITPRVDIRQDVECSVCGHKYEMDMPLDLSFFFPELT